MPKPALPLPALLTRIAVVGLGLALFSEQAGARQLLHLDDVAGPLAASYVYWFSLLAPGFFLVALWAASNAFAWIGRGEAFGPAMVRALSQIGFSLMFGAFAAIVVQPSLIFLIGNGFTDMRFARFDIDIENLTLALVGGVLVLLARQGQILKSKLDEFV
jgi:hypothetical protein